MALSELHTPVLPPQLLDAEKVVKVWEKEVQRDIARC